MPVSKAIEDDTVHPYTSLLALTEAEYILCRDIGWNRAREKVEKLILSRAIEIVEDERILHEAARTKCERSIALGDCYTIALAEKLKGAAVFARQEDDLEKEIRRKPFSIKLVFLETPPKRKRA